MKNIDYKKENKELKLILQRLISFNELVYKRYDRIIKDYPIRSFSKHNLEIIKGKEKERK